MAGVNSRSSAKEDWFFVFQEILTTFKGGGETLEYRRSVQAGMQRPLELLFWFSSLKLHHMSRSGRKEVRNFTIIAHIDYGKSTLSDRLIQFCSGLTDRETCGKARFRGRRVVTQIRLLIPRQMLDVAIQAPIGPGVIYRETVQTLRENVTAKCYRGEFRGKRKLLEKQNPGKKRMKQVGSVSTPQEAFLSVLRVGN